MSVNRYMSADERFEAQCIPVPEAGCWLWLGSLVKGYGQFQLSPGVRIPAHRYALQRKLGRPVLGSALACHTCDTPSCVNQDHVYEGTAQTNADDMVARGRSLVGVDCAGENRCRGVDHHSAKLTPADVLMIRSRPASYKQLAKRFGISTTAVARIVQRKTWKHVEAA